VEALAGRDEVAAALDHRYVELEAYAVIAADGTTAVATDIGGERLAGGAGVAGHIAVRHDDRMPYGAGSLAGNARQGAGVHAAPSAAR
jgi:hypothetical protein